jgi:hypothetical protein
MRMRDRIAYPLEKITDRVGCGEMPAGKEPGYRQKQNDSLKKMIHDEWPLCTTLRSVQIPSHATSLNFEADLKRDLARSAAM